MWVAPRATDPLYNEVLRTAHLLAGLWPPLRTDGRAIVASRGDHDLSAERHRALPNRTPPPDDLVAHADPADLELARHIGIPLRDAQRIDVDLPDSILANVRVARSERGARSRLALWARIVQRAPVGQAPVDDENPRQISDKPARRSAVDG